MDELDGYYATLFECLHTFVTEEGGDGGAEVVCAQTKPDRYLKIADRFEKWLIEKKNYVKVSDVHAVGEDGKKIDPYKDFLPGQIPFSRHELVSPRDGRKVVTFQMLPEEGYAFVDGGQSTYAVGHETIYVGI